MSTLSSNCASYLFKGWCEERNRELKLEKEHEERKIYDVPRIGDVILINEVVLAVTASGNPGRPKRTVVYVKGYVGSGTNTLILVDVLRNSTYSYETTFRAVDFAVGILRFVKLDKRVNVCDYRWGELNIFQPAESINCIMNISSKARLLEEGDNSEDYGYLRRYN